MMTTKHVVQAVISVHEVTIVMYTVSQKRPTFGLL